MRSKAARSRAHRPGAVPVALLVGAAVLLAGCASADSLVVADVPPGDLASGWDLDRNRSTKQDVQAGPITVAAFATQVYDHDDRPRGLMAIVTVSDVPFADIDGRIRDQFQQRLEDEGVQRTQRRTGTVHVDGTSADYTLFDAEMDQEGARVEGLVIEYTYKCPDQSTVVGFLGLARTEVGTALGSSTDFATWEEIAGSDWRNDVGGMAERVECGG